MLGWGKKKDKPAPASAGQSAPAPLSPASSFSPAAAPSVLSAANDAPPRLQIDVASVSASSSPSADAAIVTSAVRVASDPVPNATATHISSAGSSNTNYAMMGVDEPGDDEEDKVAAVESRDRNKRGAGRRDWEVKLEEWEQKYAALQQKYEQLQDVNKITEDIQQTLENEVAGLTVQLNKALGEEDGLRAKIRQCESDLLTAQQSAELTEKKLAEVTQSYLEAARATKELTEVKLGLAKAEAAKDDAEKKVKALTDEVAKLKARLLTARMGAGSVVANAGNTGNAANTVTAEGVDEPGDTTTGATAAKTAPVATDRKCQCVIS